MERFWDTPEKLEDLLCELVSWESIYLTQGEAEFPVKLKGLLGELDYFKQHPDHLEDRKSVV